MDFSEIRTASRDQQIRAYSVEQSTLFLRDHGMDPPYQDLINLSKMVEDYITHGDVFGVIQTAVEEGYSEGRLEVKEAVEEWFSNVDLDDLFKTKGWIKPLPQEGNNG